MIGQIVEEIRKHKGLTQAQLADLAGVSQPLISQIEGSNYTPSLRNLEKIAQVLGMPAYELMRRAAEYQPAASAA